MAIVLPIGSLHDIFTYSWLMFMDVYGTLVVKYTIHGFYGLTCGFWIKGNLQVDVYGNLRRLIVLFSCNMSFCIEIDYLL